MADPAWSDATRDDLHTDLGFGLNLFGDAQAHEFLYHPQNSKFLAVTTDENALAKLSVVRLTACKPLLDTDPAHFVYCTLTDETPGAGQARLRVYKEIGRSTLIAEGSAADGATLTLVAQTGYTFAGTLKLDTISATFSFAWQIITPPVKRIAHLFDNTSIDDEQLRTAGLACLSTMRNAFGVARQAAEGFVAFILNVKARRLLSSLTDATELAVEGLEASRTSRGTVNWNPSGLLIDLENAQDDNTGGSGEIKAGAGAWSGSPSYGSWTGKTTTAPVYGQRAKPALLTFTCKKALTGTPPEFEVTRRCDDNRFNPNDGTASEVATLRLAVGQTWREPAWGIEQMLIDYAPTADNDGSDTAISETSTDWSVAGLKATLSDGGKFWGIYYLGVFEFYDSETARNERDADHLVAQKTFASTSTAFTTETNDNGLVIVGKSGGTLTSGHKFTVDFNAPQPGHPVSIFTLTIAETTQASSWVRRLRDGAAGGQPWQPNTGASPNLQDGWVDGGMPLTNAAVQGDKV